MCVILVAIEHNSRFPLVLAANRDEYYHRPSAVAHFWSHCPDLLAGQDLECGGTWLGMTRKGKIAAVTNHFEPNSRRQAPRSRGQLISEFLQSNQSADEYAAMLRTTFDQYNGYGLLFGDIGQLRYQTNKSTLSTVIRGGVHALSNSLINTPWPRVQAGKRLLTDLLKRNDDLVPEHLFQILSDQQSSDTAAQKPHNHPADAPLFIRSKHYGTRTSTVIIVDRDRNVVFEERTYEENTCKSHERQSFEFSLSD